MSTSIIDSQRDLFLSTLRQTNQKVWMVLVVDEHSQKLLESSTNQDDVLNANITNIERLEESRETQPETPAIYLLSPLPHIVELLKADLNRRRYEAAHIIWTSQLRRDLAQGLYGSESRKKLIRSERALNLDFFPRESHIIVFREKWSFQILFNPKCDSLIRQHFDGLTQKILSVCVALGEYPQVRYFRPDKPTHDAGVLCSHLARFVQDALDEYARDKNNNFPPPAVRPRATLLITDRSMDLMSPLVHELTYQAMAMDLLPIQEDTEKITYRNVIRRGQPDQEEKDVELNEKDKIWVENRHLHMKDLLVKLSDDFRKFQAKNPQFADNNGQNISVNTIKDMLAGLPEFQEGKEAFSLHIDMAERCAKLFQDQKLLDITSLEQSLATGLDEDNRKPANITDQLVRLLADDSVVPDNRARLLIIYIIYRGGILPKDVEKLIHHGELPSVYREIVFNMQNLGARIIRSLGDNSNLYHPLFATKETTYAPGEEVSLSRFEPMLRYALEALCQGSLDQKMFPPVKPYLDDPNAQSNAAQTSLRSAGKPTWANSRQASNKPRQRVIVFMAGGATYAESRACYEVSQRMGKEVFLATSHMLTPKTFLRQVSELGAPRQALRLPFDARPPDPPAWLNEAPPPSSRPEQPQTQPPKRQANALPSGPRPPTEAMGNMNLGPPKLDRTGTRPTSSQGPTPPSTAGSGSTVGEQSSGKLKKEKKDKHHFGGLFRKH